MIIVLEGRVASFVDFLHVDDLLSPLYWRHACIVMNIGNKPKCHCEILGKCEGKLGIWKYVLKNGTFVISMENRRKIMGLEKLIS